MMVSMKKIIPVVVILTLVFVNAVVAATIVKANNATNLNNGGSWTNGTSPSPTDIAQWNSTSSPTGNTISLGGDVSWQGAQITNPSGWITINAGSGILYLGSSGIDMSSATQSFTMNCNMALNADQTWNVNAGHMIALVGVASGTHSLTKNGSGTLIFAGANTFSGNVTINLGLVQVGDVGNENVTGLGTGTVTVNSGAIRLTPGSTTTPYSIANSFVLNGGTIIGQDGIQRLATGGATFAIGASGGTVEATYSTKDVYIDGILSGSTTLALKHGDTTGSAAGVHITNPANSFSGTVTVTSSGQNVWLNLDNNTALQNATVSLISGGAGTPYFVMNSSGTNTIAGLSGSTGIVFASTTTAGTYTLNVNNANNNTFGGLLENNTGVLALTKTGAGTLTLSGNNTYTGLTTVNAGTLSLTGTPTSNALKYVINSGGTISVADRSNLSVAPAGFTADFMTINGGMLSTANASSNPATANYGVTRGFTLGASGGTIDIPNTYNSNIVPILGVIAGTGAMTKTGVGTLNLQGANTYSGNTTISAGTLQLGAANVIPNGTNKGNVNDTGTLDLNTFSDTINGLSGTGTVTSGAAGTPTLTVGNNNVSSTFSGVIQNGSGTVALTKVGTGTLTLSGTNSYTGATTISAGVLSVDTLANGNLNSNIGASTNAAANLVFNGGTLKFTGASSQSTNRNFTVNSTGGGIDASGTGASALTLSGFSTIAGGSPTFTLSGSNTSANTLSGVLSGALSLIKSSAGKWVISGANTYTGATTVSNGTLLVNNSSGSGTGTGAVTVSSGATLGGTGTIGTKASTVTVNSGGTLVPGAGGPGKLTINNNLTFSSGATFSVQINGPTPSSGYSQAIDTGTVTLGNATLSLTLGYTPTAGQTFTIIDNDGTDAVVNTFNGIAEGGVKTAVFNGTTYTFIVSYRGGTGNDVVLMLPIGPSITTQPTDQSVVALTTATFFVKASGTAPLAYKWLKNGTDSVGSSDTLRLPSVPVADDKSWYKCRVKNIVDSVWSNACTLHVITSIGSFSYSQNYLAGLINTQFVPDTPRISGYVTHYSISPLLPAGLKIDSTTGIISGTPTVQFDSAGFIVAASNGSGGDSTAGISIKVFSKAKVTASPVNQTAIINNTVKFIVAASGSKPLTYTWYSLQTNLPIGTNSDTLTLSPNDATYDNTRYKCIVQNTFQSTYFDTSKVCTLHVNVPPVIDSLRPLSETVSEGGSMAAPFTAYAHGTMPIAYKWLRSGTDSVGAASALSFSNVGLSADGTWYQCQASNSVGSVLSAAACTLKVASKPHVTVQPATQTINVGDTAKFGIAAVGALPLHYKWLQWTPSLGSYNVVGIDANQFTFKVASTDDNLIYRCAAYNVIQGNTYFDTSKACTLHVIVPPKITQQPVSKTVLKASTVVFSVTASGTPPFSYVWMKNGTDTAGTANPLTLTSVASSVDKSAYRCIVSNQLGADISALCTLRVVCAAFGGSPQTGFDSLSVAFIDSSTGGVGVWQWDFGDGGAATTQNPAHKYTAPGGYTVKLKVSAGTVSDSMVQQNFVTVSYSKPIAAFGGSPLTARDSVTVHFSDSSKGVVTGRQWTFGDGTALDSTKNPVHTYKQPGSYSVTLKVTGTGGVDSLTKPAYVYVYSKLDNPVRLSGRRLSTTKVELTFSYYDSIPTSKNQTILIPPWSDSLGVWFRKDSLPSTAQPGTWLQTINLPSLQGAAKPFKDTVTVTPSLPADSVFYGFSTALYWNDGTKSVMQGGNGTLVLMKDTVRPVNTLVISGRYLGVDTAAVYLDNVSSIDTGKVDSVAVWYGLRDSVNFSDTSYTKWFPVSAVISGAIANRYTYKKRDPQFNADTVRVYVAVEVMGKNRMTSIEKDTSFIVGRIRPINPIRLKAKAISASVIQLTWNRISGFDRIRIWKGLQAVPLVSNVPAAQYDTLVPAVTDTTIFATGLTEKHWYYFGAQVLQSGLWSKVTDSASARDSTPASKDTAKIANTIKIMKFVFDTTRNALFMTWHVDTLDTNFKAGIEYSLKDYPVDSTSAPTQVVTIKSRTDSAVVKLNESLALDTTYYVSMWMGRNGKWALPTDSSKAKTTTPTVTTWQVVSYFSKVHDTVLAFGGRVVLANASTDTQPTMDTLRIFRAPAGGLNGLVPVSIGFSFTDASARMDVGLKVDTLLLPKGSTLADVRIYRRDTSGLYLVENGTVLDAAGGIVWVLTKDLGAPFIAMVDTIAPVVTVLNSTKGAVKAGVALYDTIQIVDNILNASWVFQYAKGANSYAAGGADSGGTVWGLKDTVIVRVGETSVSSGSGVRVIFVASDAVNFDTANVSRQVIRDSMANTISTVEMKWTPLWVTTRLDTSPAKLALKDLGDKNGWTYDNTKFRLFRWLSYDANANSPDNNKWVEYADSGSIAWVFNFDPGRLFWIKTRTHTVLHLGSGVTPLLTEPSKIVLVPVAKSDVALPFDFSICVGDIIEATNSDSEKARGKGDSLQYNSFVVDSTGRYRLEPLYYGDWGATAPEHMDKTALVTGGFCIYNPYKASVTLSIPATPSSMSKQKPGVAKKKGQTSEGWSVRVKGRTAEGSVLSTVYCGQSEGTKAQVKFYPAMPLIEGEGIRVCDDKLRQWGHEMAQGLCAKDGGVTYLLAFNGQSNTTGEITYHVENLEALPKGLRAVIMDPGTDTVMDASAQLHVSVGEGTGSSYRKLVIGSVSYIAKAKAANRFYRLALIGASPNPFGRMLRIRYSLPYGGIGRVEFSMIDLRGRQLWAGQGPTGPGLRELVWNGTTTGRRPVASGMYVLWMKALDTKGKTAGVFEKRVTYLP